MVCSVSQDYSDAYWRRYAYLVIFYFPLALLDIRIPLGGIIIRLSDIYLIALVTMLLLGGMGCPALGCAVCLAIYTLCRLCGTKFGFCQKFPRVA